MNNGNSASQYNQRRCLRILSFILVVGFLINCLFHSKVVAAEKKLTIGILMANDSRQGPVEGFKSGMREFSDYEEHDYVYTVLNAGNEKSKLPQLAQEIVAIQPDIVVAAGGIEADALMAATRNTNIPVIFLSVSSSIERGLSSKMTVPDKNCTGIETNDTVITAKRLWFIKRVLPDVKTVMCFHIPSNVPSVASINIARKKAVELQLQLIIKEVESVEEIQKITKTLSRGEIDVILLNPVAIIHGAMKNIILPKAMEEGIPVFGYGRASVQKGAFASYGGSRYSNGKQAARLAHKIIHGENIENIPIETPEKYEFIINKWMVDTLGVKLSNKAYRMADDIVEISF